MPYFHHPLTLHPKRARPRVQLTEDHAQKLQMPIIDGRSADVNRIVFPNGRVNYVLLARQNSKCHALRALHKHVSDNSEKLDRCLSSLSSKRIKDDLAGGRYIVSGFGNMGRNVSETIRPPDQPAMRKSLTLAQHERLAERVGIIFSHVAECIAMHCGRVYEENHELMINKNLAWPTERHQNKWKWLSSQFIVRQWGQAMTSDWPRENELVAAHTDTGDLSCTSFNCYMTGGGRRGKGGPVADTDLAAFEHSEGGAGYRVKTCIEDTVVVPVMNSESQLHGCIKSAADFIEDGLAHTTRIIPYIPQGVYNWMMRNPDGAPFMNIP